ncbi:MAG TPA: ABC transporter substrate-binding protein [Candidatus Avacidaminococcus intestinavium]|uniref:ABC transporter substrate-binding protein n=1 Tax=Candidatus Avacidaminococcus intestinavium TaxID=2840684 RepID=A0A9D1SKR1_9FIRM|nr:ABC transporter substrate-binding protein [Candidatus Avacidaminococcus intestinavium]
MKKLTILCAMLTLLLFTVGCSTQKATSETPKENAKISLAMLRLTSSAPLFIALEKGYFAEENLDVTPEWFDAAHPIAVATASSKVDIGATGITASLFNMAAADQKLAIVADKGREEKGFPSSALIANTTAYDNGLTTIENLKGKRIGITQIGSTFHYMIGRLLESKGLALSDVELVPLGKLSAVMAALESKQIDACILNEPNITKVQTAGYGKLVAQVGDTIPYQTSGIFFSPEFVKNEDLAIRFLRAYAKACNYYYDAALDKKSPEKFEEVVQIIAKFTKAPVEDIKIGLPYIDRDGRLLADDIKTQIDWYASHNMLNGQLTATQVVNTTLLEKALKK